MIIKRSNPDEYEVYDKASGDDARMIYSGKTPPKEYSNIFGPSRFGTTLLIVIAFLVIAVIVAYSLGG